MRRFRGLLAAAAAILVATAFGGCGRESGQSAPGAPQPPARIGQYGNYEPIPHGLEPGSVDEWVALVDPAEVDLEQLALELELTILGVEEYSGYAIVLFDDGGQDLGPGDFGQDGLLFGVPNDPVNLAEGGSLVIGFIGGEWTLPAARGQSGFEALLLDLVHATATGVGTKIGVVDTGARIDHLAFAGNLQILEDHRLTSGELDGDGIDNDGDGLIDEGLGHGTMVTSIAATVAPGATMLPVKVLNDDGVGSMLGVISGLLVCRELGCEVINMSIVLSDYHQDFEDLLEILANDGIIVTCAAGNDGPETPRYPAVSPNAVGVGAVDMEDLMTSYSGAGPLIRIASPGHRVIGAGVQGIRGRAWASGTSMAAPGIAGSIAVVCEALDCSAGLAMQLLAQRTDPVDPTTGVQTGRVAPIRVVGAGGSGL